MSTTKLSTNCMWGAPLVVVGPMVSTSLPRDRGTTPRDPSQVVVPFKGRGGSHERESPTQLPWFLTMNPITSHGPHHALWWDSHEGIHPEKFLSFNRIIWIFPYFLILFLDNFRTKLAFNYIPNLSKVFHLHFNPKITSSLSKIPPGFSCVQASNSLKTK